MVHKRVNPPITVRLLVHYLGHEPGDVIHIEQDFARALIQQGRAEPVTKSIDKPAKDKMMRRKKTK